MKPDDFVQRLELAIKFNDRDLQECKDGIDMLEASNVDNQTLHELRSAHEILSVIQRCLQSMLGYYKREIVLMPLDVNQANVMLSLAQSFLCRQNGKLN